MRPGKEECFYFRRMHSDQEECVQTMKNETRPVGMRRMRPGQQENILARRWNASSVQTIGYASRPGEMRSKLEECVQRGGMRPKLEECVQGRRNASRPIGMLIGHEESFASLEISGCLRRIASELWRWNAYY
jgi:hypothetical protein